MKIKTNGNTSTLILNADFCYLNTIAKLKTSEYLWPSYQWILIPGNATTYTVLLGLKKKSSTIAGYSSHFQVGGDNRRSRRGLVQNQYAKQSRILLSLWHFHFCKQNKKCNLHRIRLLWNALHSMYCYINVLWSLS